MPATPEDRSKFKDLLIKLDTAVDDCQTTLNTFLKQSRSSARRSQNSDDDDDSDDDSTETNPWEMPPGGNTLLAMKSQLLTHYLTHLGYFATKRLSPPDYSLTDARKFILQSAKTRTFLEKTMAIEQKLQYQLDKVVRQALLAEAGGSTGPANPDDPTADPLSFKPRPDALGGGRDDDDDDDEEEDEDDDGDEKQQKKGTDKYVPPKLIRMAGIEDDLRREREEKAQKKRSRLASTNMLAELRAELNADEPMEISNRQASHMSEARRKLDDVERAQTNFEEEFYTRLPVSGKTAKARRRIRSSGSNLDGLTDFRDLRLLTGDGDGGKKRGGRGKKRSSHGGGKKTTGKRKKH